MCKNLSNIIFFNLMNLVLYFILLLICILFYINEYIVPINFILFSIKFVFIDILIKFNYLNKKERNYKVKDALQFCLSKYLNYNLILHGEYQNKDKPKIFIVNHKNWADPGVLKSIFPNLCFVAKAEIGKQSDFKYLSYISNKILDSFNLILYDRGGKKNGKDVRNLIKKELNNGNSVVVFAEGSAYAFGGVRDFYPGSFELAYENNFIIQPITIKYMTDITYGEIEKESKAHHLSVLENIFKSQKNKRNDVHVTIHEELTPRDFEDATHLRKYTKYVIEKELINRTLD